MTQNLQNQLDNRERMISFSCPSSLFERIEKIAKARGLTVTEYVTKTIQDSICSNEGMKPTPEKPPPNNHPLVSDIYQNHETLRNPEEAYQFFHRHYPEIIEKMELTAILMRKTDFNDFVIEDLIASLLPEPFDPIALQTILEVYQTTAQKLDVTLQEADKIKTASKVYRAKG